MMRNETPACSEGIGVKYYYIVGTIFWLDLQHLAGNSQLAIERRNNFIISAM